MKRFISMLLCFLLICGVALGASPATPTDLYETIEDDDFGHIDNLERQVFLDFLNQPKGYIGEEITLIAILINFKVDDIYTFNWEYSEDGDKWQTLNGVYDQTYTFILDQENYAYWWRVHVTWEEYL